MKKKTRWVFLYMKYSKLSKQCLNLYESDSTKVTPDISKDLLFQIGELNSVQHGFEEHGFMRYEFLITYKRFKQQEFWHMKWHFHSIYLKTFRQGKFKLMHPKFIQLNFFMVTQCTTDELFLYRSIPIKPDTFNFLISRYR